MRTFVEAYSKYILPDDILVLAVSGGVDSMVLLDLAQKHHPREKIIVAHFDHSLRGAESDEDRGFIANFCKKENLTFEYEKMDIAKCARDEKMSIESVARKYRYDFLFRVAKKYDAKYILTAHHLDDRIETAMFHLIRGTKLGGFTSLEEISLLSSRRDPFQIQVGEENEENLLSKGERDFSVPLRNDKKEQKPNIILFRPLLGFTKKEILEYAREHVIGYREDSTNTDTKYQRNKLRHDILPQFESINPEYRRALSNFIDYTEELKSWVDEEVRQWIQDSKFKIQNSKFRIQNSESRVQNQEHDDFGDDKIRFLVADFESRSPFFQKEIIRYLYEGENQGTVGLSEGNIEELRRYILTAEGGTEKTLGNLILKKRQNIIVLS